MSTISTKYIGGFATEATHDDTGATIVTSSPSLYGGGEQSCFSPTDLFVASLTSCIFTIMGVSAHSHGFSIDGATAKTTKHMAENPRRVERIDIEIHFPHSNYTEKERKLLEACTRACPVGRSIHPDIVENIKLVFPE